MRSSTLKVWVAAAVLLVGYLRLTKGQGYDDEEEDGNEKDFEVFQNYDGPESESIYPDPGLDISETTYFQEEEGDNRRSFKLVDPQPRVTKSFLYVSPEQVQDRLIRSKRAPDDEEEPEDYDYTKGYQQFVKENFGIDDPRLTNVEYDTDTDTDDEYERIKELSDKENEESKRHPEFCKVVQKDGKDCTICKNPKNNAKSESCSYSSNPTPKKYAYKRERNYNSKDDEDDDDDYHEEDASEKKEQKVPRTQPRATQPRATQPRAAQPKATQPKATKPPKQKKRKTTRQTAPRFASAEAESTSAPYYSSKIAQGNPADKADKYFNQGFKYVAPTHQRYLTGNSKNVERVLEEFKKKDWSKCKRKSKNGLTCYYCKDAAGVSNEECMYISDDEPQSSSYEEVSESKPKQTRTKPSSSQRVPRRSKNISSSRRFSASSDDSLNPATSQESYPTEKRTFKRMVSVKLEGSDQEPNANKAVFYAKKITHFTK